MIARIRSLLVRLGNLFRRTAQNQDLNEELQSHLDMQMDEFMQQGMSQQEAYRKARLKLGHPAPIKEACRDQQRFPLFDSLLQDFRFSLRFWKQRPLLVLAATVTLALAIGMNVAIFSTIDSILLTSIPYPDSERLVLISLLDESPRNESVTRSRLGNTELLEFWQQENKTMSGMAGYSAWMTTVGSGGDPERIYTALTTPDFFPLLGIQPLMGRFFSPEESRPGSNQVVILGHHYWQGRFGGDPDILHQKITLEGKPYQVVGIMPADFKPYVPGLGRNIGLFFPITEISGSLAKSPIINVIGKLREGTSLPQAQDELRALSGNYTGNRERLPEKFDVRVFPLHEELYGSYRPLLMIFLGCSSCILLIGCINLMNVILAQLTGRTKELAMRAALGAKRIRLIQQMLMECFVLVLPGALLGILVAAGLVHLMVTLYPLQLPRIDELKWSGNNFWFLIGCVLFSSIMIGLFPAWKLTRDHVADVHHISQSPTRSQNRTGAFFLAVQTALALVILSSATLLIRSFQELRMTDPGYRKEGILTSQVSLPEKSYPTPESHAMFADQIQKRLASIPGVHSAAITNSMPLVFNLLLSVDVQVPDSPYKEKQRIGTRAVSKDFNHTFGMPLISGRFLNEQDEKSLESVVVNQQFARKYFGDTSPLGKQLLFGEKSKTIVGVLRDIRNMKLQWEAKPEIYIPFAAYPSSMIDIAIYTDGNPASLTPAVRAELRQIDSSLALSQISTIDRNLNDQVMQWSFRAWILGLFAMLAIALAAIGIYGVTAYMVRLRNKEFGIRMALGAQPKTLLNQVLRYGMLAPMAGVIAGIPLALFTGKWLESMLYGIEPFDPVTYTSVSVILLAIALLGILIPSFRVTRINPAETLRAE